MILLNGFDTLMICPELSVIVLTLPLVANVGRISQESNINSVIQAVDAAGSDMFFRRVMVTFYSQY